MYESYWGLTALPFQNVPDPKFFCPLPAFQEILDKLLYVVQSGKGGALLTGEIGSGKSTLSRVFLIQLEEARYDIGLVINPSIPPEELLREIALQLGLSAATAHRPTLFRALSEHLTANAQTDKTTVLVIDEAHTIKDESAFEDLRMLLNFQSNDRQLLTLILLGAPELRATVAQQRALDQRLAVRLNLSPLREEDAGFYIGFRLRKAGATKPIFTEEAIAVIAREAKGIPRRINNLCDLCLLEGWKRKVTAVDTSLVKAAAALS